MYYIVYNILDYAQFCVGKMLSNMISYILFNAISIKEYQEINFQDFFIF